MDLDFGFLVEGWPNLSNKNQIRTMSAHNPFGPTTTDNGLLSPALLIFKYKTRSNTHANEHAGAFLSAYIASAGKRALRDAAKSFRFARLNEAAVRRTLCVRFLRTLEMLVR